MQRLTYINLLNEQIVFERAPYVLCRVAGLGLPEVSVSTLRGAYQQGDTVAGLRREARHITVTAHLLGDDRRDLYERRLRLMAVLSPGRASEGERRARLIYENDSGRWQTWAVPEGGLDASSRVRDIQPSLKLSFRCESPYWYAVNESETAFTYSGAGFAAPFSFPISFGSRDFSREVRNDGQVDAPVEVWIEGRGETPSLVNLTTGKTLALSSQLPNGHTLYLNTDPARLIATVTDGTGAASNAFGLLSVDAPLADFCLRPGLNRLRYEPGGEAAQSVIRVKWRAAYEGV